MVYAGRCAGHWIMAHLWLIWSYHLHLPQPVVAHPMPRVLRRVQPDTHELDAPRGLQREAPTRGCPQHAHAPLGALRAEHPALAFVMHLVAPWQLLVREGALVVVELVWLVQLALSHVAARVTRGGVCARDT